MPTPRELANAIRALSMDAVQKATSGHPGMPMGMADIAEVLWNDFLQHNPNNPHWFNRDRFILSNGHGCMLHYALLHLTGYALTIDDIKQLRQLHSKTPGHPEYGHTPGIETTTGPLGQGLANAVGMAIAEKHLAAQFNREKFAIVDHYTYVFVGDGCLMEGISHEACSFAGTLGLGKLIAIYDDNNISIDGEVTGWFTDNTPQRFEAYGWHVIPNVDGHDREAVRQAILKAQAVTDKPSIICCKTHIGYGAPNRANTAKAHGEALGEAEVALARKELQWPYPAFEIPQDYYQAWDARAKGDAREQHWNDLFSNYQKHYPELAQEFLRRVQQQLPADWETCANEFLKETQRAKETMATRKASFNCLNYFSKKLPELLGGSADLTGSNLTQWKDAAVFSKNNPAGQYVHYGVREFGMTAILNGIALHRGLLPFGGTFLVFSDYARNAVRLAAMMQSRLILVYSHDSVGIGEDGPTHQPIEHISSLRLIPNLSVWRPCDTVESSAAWQKAIEHQGPTCLLFTRQNVVCQDRDETTLKNIARGGYILKECHGTPELILIATGSEVALAVSAYETLTAAGKNIRVVSMPSTDVFLAQDPQYQEKVIPKKIMKRLAIEAGASVYWYKLVGCHGNVIGIDRFGTSAPAADAFKECGITVDHVLSVAKKMLTEKNNLRLEKMDVCE